jgi:hypothetical protein
MAVCGTPADSNLCDSASLARARDSEAMDLEDLRGRLAHGWNQMGRIVFSKSRGVCPYCGVQHLRQSKRKGTLEKVFLALLKIEFCRCVDSDSRYFKRFRRSHNGETA